MTGRRPSPAGAPSRGPQGHGPHARTHPPRGHVTSFTSLPGRGRRSGGLLPARHAHAGRPRRAWAEGGPGPSAGWSPPSRSAGARGWGWTARGPGGTFGAEGRRLDRGEAGPGRPTPARSLPSPSSGSGPGSARRPAVSPSSSSCAGAVPGYLLVPAPHVSDVCRLLEHPLLLRAESSQGGGLRRTGHRVTVPGPGVLPPWTVSLHYSPALGP